MEINKEDIKSFYQFLGHNGYTELRPIKPRWNEDKKPPISYFFTNVNELINKIEELNGIFNIYIGLNERENKGKNDEDIKWIKNIGHDIDAHESGVDGKIIAGQVAIEILKECVNNGYKEPLILDSGRGYWIIHHISPIQNTKENVEKIKEFGKRIKNKHEKEGIKLDLSVYNPSRIARVSGTINISNENNFVLSSIVHLPSGEEDKKLREDILKIEIPKYVFGISQEKNFQQGICSFMDYCLTHEIPKGERHKVISRNIAIYISDHPQRELLKEQYIKIQNGSINELDGWLKNIDEQGKSKFPFSIGELVNFTKKYKIPFDWKVTSEYKQWIKEKKSEDNLRKAVSVEKQANEFEKAIRFFTNKRDLAKQFLKVQPLYFDIAKNWWFWSKEELRWIRTDETNILNMVDLTSMADTITASEKNEIIESLRQEGRKNKPDEIKKTWIQFKDTIYDIETEEKFKAESKYFVTNPLPFELNFDDDSTPTIDKVFGQWVGENKIKLLYEIISYCLLPDYPINRIFCFIGNGMNGKSKFLELLRKFVGSQNCCSTELDLLIQSRFEVTRLHKKLVCQMGETNFNELYNTSILKKLSGGDLIGFEYKRADLFDDINY